jgi:octaprenyl-diphosphate synthase
MAAFFSKVCLPVRLPAQWQRWKGFSKILTSNTDKRKLIVEKRDLLGRLQPKIVKVEQAMRDDLLNLAGKQAGANQLPEVLEHALFNGGKRIRPLLCILAARLCGEKNDAVYRLAIAFEYLHVATLLHDDVIDQADTRRGLPTVNNAWGLTQAILTGDFLHARSMYLIGRIGGEQSLTLINRATEAMVEGEFLQLYNARNYNQSEKDYFSVINGKTALFIGAVCEAGGIFAGGSEQELQALNIYGANLGKAFQIKDDLLDYLGDAAITGKAIGNDFSEGKMTLPLIHTLQQADTEERSFLLNLLKGERQQRIANIDGARNIIDRNNGFLYAEKLAEKLIDEAIASLQVFTSPQNQPHRETLAGLAHFVLSREK